MKNHCRHFLTMPWGEIVTPNWIESPDRHASWENLDDQALARALAAHVMRLRDRLWLWEQCRYRCHLPCNYMQSVDMYKGEVYSVLTSIQKGWKQ